MFHVRLEAASGWNGPTKLDVTLVANQAKGGIDFSTFGGPAVKVTSVSIGDGSYQRSNVSSISILLDGLLSSDPVDPSAFFLQQTQGTPNGNGVVVLSVAPTGNGGTLITLGFTGTGLVNGSLADGKYRLAIDGSKLRDVSGLPVDAVGTGSRGSVRSFYFSRLLGDVSGDTHVNFDDFLILQNAFGSKVGTQNYVLGADLNVNGMVDFNDFLILQNQFGFSL